MVILRIVLHLQLPLSAAPPSGSAVSVGAIAAVMAVILTIAVVGAVTLAVAARRLAMGGRDSSARARPRDGGSRGAGQVPTDAWSEAGRRMPVPPREEDRT